MTNIILTQDNRLIAKNRTKSFEILGYVTEFYLSQLEKEIQKLRRHYLVNTIGTSGLIRLTAKQWNVIKLWQGGMGNSEIAAELKTSPQAIANHKKRVLKKMRQLQKDSEFRLKTEKDYREMWSQSRLYKVQFVQEQGISIIEGKDGDEGGEGLENVFFSDMGQSDKSTQGEIMRQEILAMLNPDEQQLAQWLEEDYTPKECHEMMSKQGRKIALISVYKMIYRMRDKLKGYKND